MQSYREQPEIQRTYTKLLQDMRVPLGIAGILTFIWVFLSLTPLPPNDLWWHMAAGRTMLHEGALLTENRWAYTLPASAPYIYQSWLSEILMYGIWKLGGIPMLSLARMILITGSYGVIAWHTARHTGNTKATFYTLILAILIGYSNWTLRPQTVALLPGALFLAVLGEFLDGRLRPQTCVIALPLLMVLWVNIHGSFVLGIALVALALGGKAIERVRKADTHTSLRALALAALLTLVAAMANPLGWGIFAYVRGMLQNTALQRWFIEWQPPRPSLNILDPDARFFLMIIFMMFLLAQGKKRPSLTHTLWFCALAWLSFSGIRYVMWFGLLCNPLIAHLIGAYLPKAPAGAQQPKASAIQLGICAALLVAALPWFQLNLLLGAGSSTLFASQGSYRTLIADTTPIGAGEWLAQHPPTSGRMWTNMTYASYLEWRTPEIQQFTDLRVELFPVDIWEQSFAIAAAKDDGIALLDRWQITTLLLDRRRDTKLLDRIKADPGWCERYTDRDSQIFQRCTS